MIEKMPYSKPKAQKEASKMQEFLEKGYNLYEFGDWEKKKGTRKFAMAEKIAEGKAEVLAESHFKNSEDVEKYFKSLQDVVLKYREKLEEKFNMKFIYEEGDVRYSNSMNLIFINEHPILENAIYFIKNGDFDEIGYRRKYMPKEKHEYGYGLYGSVTFPSNYSKELLNNVHNLSKESLIALEKYREWLSSSTGRYLDAAVDSGFVSQIDAEKIRDAAENGKNIITNNLAHKFLYKYSSEESTGNDRYRVRLVEWSKTTKWAGEQLYYIAVDKEEDQK